MINFKGCEEIISLIYSNKQEQVFEYWDTLNTDEKKILIGELQDVDFNLINRLYEHNSHAASPGLDFYPALYIPLPVSDKEKKNFNLAKKAGKEYISGGRTAALLVAGGQGTRLGFNGPKGIVPASPVKNKSLFQIHGEKILKYSKKYNISIPWLIMTSTDNYKETIQYFNKNNFFGLKKEDVLFFLQKTIPSLDTNGKLMLKTGCSLCVNPDGHGGVLTALSSSGMLEELKNRKIETISYFQVDNPLAKILDPVFIGFHILNDSEVSSKGVMKTGPDERVGVFVKFSNGKTGIVEYSDLPEEKQSAVDEKGKLLFCQGNIAIHLFKRTFIESISASNTHSLPYHTARKKIVAFQGGKEKEVNGFKFEKFIFDALTITDKNTILETAREEEFAPIKNVDGADSRYTARKLMNNLFRKWLIEKGAIIPDKVKVIEISPLLAVEADDLPDKISIPAKENVYLE